MFSPVFVPGLFYRKPGPNCCCTMLTISRPMTIEAVAAGEGTPEMRGIAAAISHYV